MLVLKGDFSEAETHLSDALDNFDFLIEVDPDQQHWVARRANIVRELGRLYVNTARVDRGSEYLASSIKVLRELLESNKDNSGWRRNLTWSLLYAADYQTRWDQTDVAAENLDAAKLHISMLLAQKTTNRETHLLDIYAELCAAQIADNRDTGSDKAASLSALEKLTRYFPGTSDPRALELEMLALTRLDRPDHARLIHERLQAMGFKGRTS